MKKKVSIVGVVGVPASYGGFETLADNLVGFAGKNKVPASLAVYCSGRGGPKEYKGAELRYIPLSANGAASIFYDCCSVVSALTRKTDVILLLGVSGAIILPLVRLVSSVHIITNVDGIEWKREKWRGFAKLFLRASEFISIKFSHEIIADNQGIAEYIKSEYQRVSHVIAYGGDHAVDVDLSTPSFQLPVRYALGLCRIEPENNVEMILYGFSNCPDLDIVFIGNWDSSSFGMELKEKFSCFANIHLLDPIYDARVLKSVRQSAFLYVHGHSAGGTNPSLVEMMHFGLPIFCFDCIFNRYTTDQLAQFFSNPEQLTAIIDRLLNNASIREEFWLAGVSMRSIARDRYTWEHVGREYFGLLLDNKNDIVSVGN